MDTRKYRRLKLSEREEISRMLAVGQSLRHIASLLERSASTISREVGRAGMNRRTYRAARSQKRAERNARRRRDAVVVERKLEDMTSIEERPAEVAGRIVPGHWEGDMLVGRNRQSFLGTLVERTTRLALLVPLGDKTAEEVRKAFARRMKRLPSHLKRSLTYDQGREMAEHKLFTASSGVKVYFAHPASPWERGANENTNGLICQFFPKGTDFNKVSGYEVKKVQDMLNGRPGETLGRETPFESFNKVLR